jgi:hypothetical protein
VLAPIKMIERSFQPRCLKISVPSASANGWIIAEFSAPGAMARPIQVVNTKIGTMVSGFEIITPAVEADFETRRTLARPQLKGKWKKEMGKAAMNTPSARPPAR